MNRQDVIKFISDEFGVDYEQLWMSFPNYFVFRNSRNRKWFALVADVEKAKLGLDGEGKVDILNIKCDPILIGSLILGKGDFPAYHMSKKSWLTVLLDGSVDGNEIKDLIRLSFEIIDKK